MRADVVAEARRWLGTPYQHQASLKGVGCDCLGLVRGVWRALIGPEPEPLPAYRPDWAELGGEELLLGAAERRLVRRTGEPEPGDVLLFRMATGAPVKHAGILSGPGSMIHTYWGRTVVETPLAAWWRSRLAAVFSFPGTD
jgi:NlpC/P60 family putative phage cell wall peptidase